jgi:hypothetical protein
VIQYECSSWILMTPSNDESKLCPDVKHQKALLMMMLNG